jgi:DNA-binding NarL/FixJ family response regulator
MRNSPLILFIDGNCGERDFYSERLRLSFPNVKIAHAATGHSGLAFCESHLVDCVVLEIDLPDMSGFEVLLRLVRRVHHPEVDVIMLTRISNGYLLEAATRNGAQAALYKATTPGEILDKAVLKVIYSKDLKRRKAPAQALSVGTSILLA